MQLTTDDNHFLGTLPPEVRSEAEQWRDALLAVVKPIQKSLELVARRFGVSIKTARRKYDEFRHSGFDIRVLVNKAKVPEAESAITPEFVGFMKLLVEQNQRKTSPALRRFKKLWRAGATIPGMDNSLPRHQLPAGFSDDNIRRAVRDAFAAAAARRGLGYAVAKYGPQILTTRANLWYGSHLMIDDLWHDNFVVYGTKKKHQLVRVLELDALDVFSGYLEDFGCKPRLQREDGSFDNLKEKYARLLVAKVFFQRGFSERGSTILAEHGTAAVSERVARILHDRSGGKIRLRESGITGEEQAVIGWRGQGKGNPRFKAALESLRNLKHNELGFLPAQTGLDRDHRPEQTHGELVQASEELKVLAELMKKNPARASQFRLRLWDYHSQFTPFLIEAYRELNHRDWHSLEGWEKILGNILIEYRTTPDAQQFLTNDQFLALPPVSQELLISAAANDPRYINRRRLSPADVKARDCRDLVKLPAWVVCEILADDFLFEDLKVEGAYFREFRDQERLPDVADGETFLFESVITKPDGSQEQLRDDKYSGFISPFDLNQLFVCDVQKRCLGIAARVKRIDRTDDEALKRAFGHREHRIAELKKPILARHAESVRDETDRLRNNAAVIEDIEGITQQKAETRKLRRFDGDAAELLDQPEVGGQYGTDRTENLQTGSTDDFSAEGLL
jgi:hypothetical protein